MPNEVSGKDRLALRLYLLGMVPPDVGDEIEDRFAEDEAYFTAYKQVERELVVEFAAGRMTPADAACFEQTYLTSAGRNQEVIVVRALLSVQAEPRSRGVWLSRNRRLVFASCLSVLAIAMGISWKLLRPGGAAQPAVLRQAPPSRAPADSSETKRLNPPESPRSQAPVQETSPPTPPEPIPSKPGTASLAASPPVKPPVDAGSPQARQDLIAADTLERQLESRYALTQLNADNTDIVSQGSALILQKNGFSAMAAPNKPSAQNIYSDGQISAGASVGVRRFGRLPGTAFVPGAGGVAASRDFANGEKLYVTKITVDRAKDSIVFDLISDAYGDAGRYRASLRFELPKGSVATADLTGIQPIIDQVFEIAPANDRNAAARTEPHPVQASPAPVAPAGPSKSIELGQSREQIVSLVGQPKSIVRAGTREVWVYADFKIVFVNGRVTDIQ